MIMLKEVAKIDKKKKKKTVKNVDNPILQK